MPYMLAFLVVAFAATYFIAVFTTILHELAHAGAAMFFTRKGAEIFIGSYGDRDKSLKVQFGNCVSGYVLHGVAIACRKVRT